MKSMIGSVLLFGFCAQAFAATSPVEILNLPSENRRLILQKQGESLYREFLNVALSEEKPMNLRWKALVSAAQVKGVEATPDLLKASESKQWYMRNAALVALSDVNPSESIKLAKKLLKDKALVVRSAAVSVLAGHSSPEIRDLLWEELGKDYNYKNKYSLWIRPQIVEILAQKPVHLESKLFIGLLSDKDSQVHSFAIRGLEKLTGVRLGEGKVQGAALTLLWKDYVKKENISL